jgi:CheY-like chemotaxis protein
VEVEKGKAAPAAVIRVRDNGAGIESTLLPRIFDLFVQSDQAGVEPRTRTRTGIGLGLTLAKRLTELHEGTIEAFSAGDGMGSEFTVRMPVIEAPAKKELVQSASKKPAKKPASKDHMYRILIVDDNADSADSMRMLLAQEGHEVEVVDNGDGATAHALRFKPHAILLDIGLPDKDGYSVAKELRGEAALRDVVIVAVTGYGGDDHKKRSRDSGIDEHMIKPVDPDQLIERIREGRARAS